MLNGRALSGSCALLRLSCCHIIVHAGASVAPSAKGIRLGMAPQGPAKVQPVGQHHGAANATAKIPQHRLQLPELPDGC
jgi:hypothetical protein